nr:proteoglycan 4 [Columba livia]XP_021154870.1 proteoglycan 4 [Columba livia]
MNDDSLLEPSTLYLAVGAILFLAAVTILLTSSHCRQCRCRSWERRRWRQQVVAAEPRGPMGPVYGPWRCIPGCTHCVKAAQELQQLLLLVWGGPGASATLDANTWQEAWQDLEVLVEQGCLPCHCCRSSHHPESLSRDGRAALEMSSGRSFGPVRFGRACSALRTHVARKGLQIRLGDLPTVVRRSHQRAAQEQSRRVPPGQRQPLPRHGGLPPPQPNSTAGNIRETEVWRQWEEYYRTEEPPAPPVPCAPRPLAPQEHSVGRPRSVGHPGQGQRDPHGWYGGKEELATNPQGLANDLRERLLRLSGATSPWDEECLWPSGSAEATPALPSQNNRVARPASIPPENDIGRQSNFTTQDRYAANPEDWSQRRAAEPGVTSRLGLSQETLRKLSMHLAKKCIEIQMQWFPAPVEQSMAMMDRSLTKRGWAEAKPLRPRSGSFLWMKLRNLIQREQDSLPGTPSAWPVPLMTPPSHPVDPRTPSSHPDDPRTPPSHLEDPRTPPSYQVEPRTPHSYPGEPMTPPSHLEDPRTPPSYKVELRIPPSHLEDPRTLPSYEVEPRTPPSYPGEPMTPPSHPEDPRTPPSYRVELRIPPSYKVEPRTPPSYHVEPRTPPSHPDDPRTPPSYEVEPRTPPSYHVDPRTPPSHLEDPRTPPSYEAEPRTPPSHPGEPRTPPYHPVPVPFSSPKPWEKGRWGRRSTEGSTGSEGTSSAYKPYWKQNHSASATRHVDSSYLHPDQDAQDNQDTAEQRFGSTIRRVQGKFHQWRRML